MAEEIIIDGVDVSGCNFQLIRDNKILCECTHATGFRVICECAKWNNCPYKQLKRKEKECEELKRELRNVENDRRWIKDKCIDAGKELGKYSFAWDGKEKNLVVQAMQLNEKYEKLRQVLQEIKEVVRTINYDTEHDYECLWYLEQVDRIQQIISEVENE